MPRFPAPPSGLTEPLAGYLRELWRHVESQPRFSIASFGATSTPNSLVSGFPGDLVVNLGSASTDSRLWILGGTDRSAITNKGWRVIRIATP